MLKPITNWSDLQRLLKLRRTQIYHCIDCNHWWEASAKEPPERCPNRKGKNGKPCRAWANSPLRGQVGRPSNAELEAK